MGETKNKKTAIFEIKYKLRLLNLLVSFIVLSLLFVIVRYLRGPLHRLLDFIPDTSMVLIVILAVWLAVLGLYLSRVLSGQIVRRMKDYSDKLDSILTLTRDLREEIYGDIVLDKIMDCSLSITGSDAGAILLLDNDNLVFKIVKGVKTQELFGKTIPKDTGIRGLVLTQGAPVLIGDAKKDGRYDANIDEFFGREANSKLCVPLKTKSATIGVLELMSNRRDFYNERDIEVISYLADQAASSIEKAKFYDDQRNYEIHLTDILVDAIERFMPEKQGHSKRVARYANIIAKAIDMPEEKKRRLYFASLLHDIGFLRIAPEKNMEKKEYSRHPLIGYEMLTPINFYRDIAPYILYHHERYDGYGYPKNLKGKDIPLESRMIAIAEAFDSMVSKVSYKVSVNFDVAIDELLKSKGGQFDPELVDLFVRDVREPLD